MKHSEGTFKGKNEYDLYYQGWLPEGNPKAVILLAHGIAEHHGRYQKLAEFLVSKDYAVYGFDYRHHGKSAGNHGYLDNYAFILDDFRTFHTLVADSHHGSKFFLFGHSMGAGIGMAYALKYQHELSGLMISGTPLSPLPHIPAAVISILRSLAAVAPGLKLYRLDSSTLSHDKTVVAAYDNDPLVYRGKLTARLAIQFLWAMHQLEPGVPQIQLPLLIMHGTGDNLCSPEGSRLAYKKAGSRDKTLKLYEGFYHEVLNEPWNYLVLDDIAAWLARFK